MQASDVADIGGPQESVDVRGFVVGFEQDEGAVAVCAKAQVDAIGRFHQPCSARLVRCQGISARLRNLNKDKALAELRMQVEQPLDRQKLLIDATMCHPYT